MVTRNGRSVSESEEANRMIDEFESEGQGATVFPYISRASFATALRRHVANPSTVNQGRNGTCGAAVICKFMAQYEPELYVSMALSLYREGRYSPCRLSVSTASTLGTDTQAVVLRTTVADLVVQGAMVHSANRLFGYNPFSDGVGLRSFFWPDRLKAFFTDCLHRPVETLWYPDAEQLSAIDYDNCFAVAAVECKPLSAEEKQAFTSSSPTASADKLYRFMRRGPFPTHYVQLTGATECGLSFWSWGTDACKSVSTDIHFLYKVGL